MSVGAVIAEFLADSDLEWEAGASEGEVVVTLPGEKKLRTVVSLVTSPTWLTARAFVVRNPDENHDRVHRFLLAKNLRLPGIAYAVDASGDVYVTGRLPAAAVTPEALDHLLGAILDASDSPFNELLALGFRTSMEKEWAWRVDRGESLRNLEAFRGLLERPGDPPREA
jgi:hypothetical protein